MTAFSLHVNIFTNLPPVAVATASATSVTVGTVVTLDGSGSYDPDVSDVITYAWTLNGSTVGLSDPAAPSPNFTASVAGSYVAELTVNDGELNSAPASVAITANAPVNHRPVANTDYYTVQKNSNNNLFVVLANDTDLNGTADIDPTTVTIKTPPTQRGTVSVNPVTGVITYSPRNGWRGSCWSAPVPSG